MPTRGFTLVEVVASLAVLLVLLSSVFTAFSHLIFHTRLTSDANQVIELLSEARGRALLRKPVMVCATHSDCRTFPEGNGLMLVIDNNNNRQRDTDEPILASVHLHDDTRISWHSFRNQPNLTYQQNGMAYFQNGHLLLCSPHGARKVVVNWIGRPHVEKVDDFDMACRSR